MGLHENVLPAGSLHILLNTGKSFVQVDPKNFYCPHHLSFTAMCLKCVTNVHSQMKMQSWNDSALIRMIRMIYLKDNLCYKYCFLNQAAC